MKEISKSHKEYLILLRRGNFIVPNESDRNKINSIVEPTAFEEILSDLSARKDFARAFRIDLVIFLLRILSICSILASFVACFAQRNSMQLLDAQLQKTASQASICLTIILLCIVHFVSVFYLYPQSQNLMTIFQSALDDRFHHVQFYFIQVNAPFSYLMRMIEFSKIQDEVGDSDYRDVLAKFDPKNDTFYEAKFLMHPDPYLNPKYK